jgi:leucyl aminopeptidase (aminopeptidase T)
VTGDFDGAAWRRVAATVLKRSLGLRRGQSVIIETWSHTLRAAEILSVEARRLGIRPILLHVPEWSFFEAQKNASPLNANALAGAELAAAAACDGYILLPASLDDFRRRELLPPPHRRAYDRRRLDWNRTLVNHSVPSVHLLASTATEPAARQFGVDLRSWRRESLRASSVTPSSLRKEAKPLARRLQRSRRITITHPNGTHLKLGLVGQRPVIDDGMVDSQDLIDGRMGTTVPGGYMVVALDDRIAEGRLVSNRPSRYRRGVISGIVWTFRNGRLDHYEIEKGRKLFDDSYRRAGRERNRPALLEIGLNPEIRDFPLAEDQERGVLTLDIGHNDDFGGRTRGSFRQFALLRGGSLLVDDRPLIRSGRLV